MPCIASCLIEFTVSSFGFKRFKITILFEFSPLCLSTCLVTCVVIKTGVVTRLSEFGLEMMGRLGYRLVSFLEMEIKDREKAVPVLTLHFLKRTLQK